MSKEKQIESLENLRKKARMAYFYLAFMLIFVFVTGFLFDTVYFAGAGIISLMIYIFCLRKDIKEYPAEYRKIATLNSVGRYIEAKAFVPKNIFTLEQVKRDGCVMIENTHGIVRAGVMGTYHGRNVIMSDISYTYQPEKGGSKRAVVKSGCYVRMDLKRDDSVTEDFYRDTGWLVIKKANGFLYGFFPHRFLGLKEPNLKRAITEKEINPIIFPEFPELLREFNSLSVKP